ncbi:MAG: methionyl-tRNA formyltransferase [Methylacidiphilales bacterium]|nr:methionyl-tRNA formyltransferase [Candidatus Methylacidiphilales bacterium]
MRIIFIGTGEIGLPAFYALAKSPDHQLLAVVTQPDRPVGRQHKPAASPIKEAAFKLHLKIYQPEKIGAASTVAQLRYLKPDLIVVAAYGQILTRDILDLPRYGCLNLHASLLPKYRGASPIQSAIMEREKQSGMTIMWMDEGLDTGDILLQEAVTLGRRETAKSLHDKLAKIGAEALFKALPLVETSQAPRTKQDRALATVTKKLSKETGLIKWDRSQKEVDAHIRAMTPWPSAYSWIPQEEDHKMLKIFTTIISNRAKGKPGEVLRVDKHGILVAAGVGGLLLREVQMEGKKRMHAADFARGFNLPVGLILE